MTRSSSFLSRAVGLALAVGLIGSGVIPAAEDGRLANLSTRAQVGSAANALTAGFVIGPGANKQVLIRGVGPALANFGLTGAVDDPVLTLFNSAGAAIATNDNWLAADAALMTRVGAFALPANSRDAALVATLAPGNYTVQVGAANNNTGLALIELYEVEGTGARLVNLSTRAQVGTGANVMIPGIVIAGSTGPRKLLIRAAGPALAAFGLANALGDPVLTVTSPSGATIYASNNDWGTPTGSGAAAAETLANAFTAAGAFAFSPASRDAAILADLAPGSYTVQVSGSAGTSGLTLVEVYDLTGVLLTSSTSPANTADYVATAATGERIPHPLAAKTYAVTAGATTIQVPENMVYVPAGSFTYGTGSTAATIVLDAYAIGRFAVTNAEWKAFLEATGSRTYPAHWSNGTYPAGKGAHPVLYISLTSAEAYCAWVSQKTGWNIFVPTAQQWEKAARGPNAYQYPWGNTFDAAYNTTTGALLTKCNFNAVVAADYLHNHPNDPVVYNDTHSRYYGVTTTVARIAAYDANGGATPFAITASASVTGWVNHDTYTGFIYTDVFDRINATGGTTTPVGSYPAGISAYGCHDMVGNVWQWTSTLSIATNGAEAGKLVNEVRGGSWYATGASCKAIGLGEGRAGTGNYNTIGFRVAMKFP